MKNETRQERKDAILRLLNFATAKTGLKWEGGTLLEYDDSTTLDEVRLISLCDDHIRKFVVATIAVTAYKGRNEATISQMRQFDLQFLTQ